MKVALIIERYHAHGGGAERWTDRLARQLIARGIETHLIARTIQSAPADAQCHRAPIAWADRFDRLAFGRFAERLLSTIDVDIAHDMGSGWRAEIIMPHHGSRVAGFERNSQLLSPWTRRWRKWAHRALPRYRGFANLERRQYDPSQQARYIAVSNMVASDLERLHGVPNDRIHTIHNGVDTELFSSTVDGDARRALRRLWGFSNETVYLIMAHNFRLKGVDELLEATARLSDRQPRIGLVVAGDGPIQRYRQLARRWKCEDKVRFVGNLAEPAQAYQAADVYVHPTYYDPCSLVVLEAWASGLPVITTRHNGASELMRDGIEGRILGEPTDIEGLAGAMESYLDLDRRQAAGHAARSLALRNSQQQNVDRVIELYHEVVSRRRWGASPRSSERQDATSAA